MIDKLMELADKCIEKSKDNVEELHKYKLIKKILNKDDCFLKMNIEYAYAILRDLHIPEDKIKEVYSQLIRKV